MDAGQMPPPVNPWMMETGSILIWIALAAIGAGLAWRSGRLSLMLLCLIAGTTSFWQEFFGDWGAYLAWNPAFDRLPLWGDMAYTTPVKPLFIPFSWGWWFAVSIPILVVITRGIKRLVPPLPVWLIALVIAFPLFLAYQLNTEGSAVSSSWWTYDAILGPSVETAQGQLPLFYPAMLGLWAALLTGLLATRDAQGFWWHERWLGIQAIAQGPKLQWARLGAFALLFQVSMFAFNIAPPIIGRLLWGGSSLLVP
jgi:hypothetical protein